MKEQLSPLDLAPLMDAVPRGSGAIGLATEAAARHRIYQRRKIQR